ncbi:hypothetical protein OU995_20385 [Roseateles sp. SL47]|nr:hypothetical protein [Roseateles sp. SL47]WAC71914.1 hypothetical protein OU995_20385 [Roseateles sp. SL47]
MQVYKSRDWSASKKLGLQDAQNESRQGYQYVDDLLKHRPFLTRMGF